MEKIAYLLGAGFSAYAGLPVMSNFLECAKDMLYLHDGNRYQHFVKVLDRVKQLSVIKNYFNADLFNIEEILSILEMQSSVSKSDDRSDFVRFVSDVIKYYSREFYSPLTVLKNSGNWYEYLFGDNQRVGSYGYFALNIHNAAFRPLKDRRSDEPRLEIEQSAPRDYAYSIITMNYDRVLENPVQLLEKAYKFIGTPQYQYENYDPDPS